MTGLDFIDNLTALKQIRDAGNHLFKQLSEGCLDNHGHGREEGCCMHELGTLKTVKHTDGRPIRRHCCLHNCPKLD